MKTMLNNSASKYIIAKFAKTKVIEVETNTSILFKAVMQDNLGLFNATVTRNANNTVDVLFSGAPARHNLPIDYAIWEYSTIWNDLKQQGHKVLAIFN